MSRKWIVVSLIVGALGSGLWNVAFAPIGNALLKVLLTFATLGISSARDSIYLSAARGYWERPSVLLLAFFGATVLVLPLFPWLNIWFSRPGKADRLSRRRKRLYPLLVVQTLLAAVFFVQLLMVVYTNRAISAFHKSLAIVTPFISSDQRNVFLGRFAKIESRSDFVQVFNDLNSIAEAHGEKRSQFSPW